MFKLSVRLEQIDLNLASYELELSKMAQEAVIQAALEFVVTATSIIPVWSGASHATFTELANAIGLPLLVSPVAGADNRTQLGAGLSSGDLEKQGHTYSFVYETELPHLVYNESNNANQHPRFNLTNPGPYNFQDASVDAAKKAVGEFRGPDPIKHMKTKVLRRRVL